MKTKAIHMLAAIAPWTAASAATLYTAGHGKSARGTFTFGVTQVPEPGTAALAGIAAGVVLRRRRRMRGEAGVLS